jgi:hypothetical protein
MPYLKINSGSVNGLRDQEAERIAHQREPLFGQNLVQQKVM